MPVPNLTDMNGVEFLAFRDAMSVHGERWRVCQAMVDGTKFVSFDLPAFYLSGFPDDTYLSRWLAQQAREYANEGNFQ